MYYIGIDGGGTYSRLVAISEDMKIIGRHAGNSTNIKAFSCEVVFDNLRKLITEFNKLTNTVLSECESVCIGSVGVDTERDEKIMSGVLSEIGFTCKITAVSDAEIVLAAEAKGGPGIAVIANSGSMGFAVDLNHKKYRCGGWGYLIDDAGSGYQIGMEAIRRSLMAADGRGEKTILADKICEQLKLKNIEEIMNIVYSENFSRAKIAELSLTVKYASEAGDKVAREIEQLAAQELSKIAISLIQRTKLYNSKIVLSGSTMLLNDSIRNKFTETVSKQYKNAEIISLKEKPEMGAAYLAIQLCT